MISDGWTIMPCKFSDLKSLVEAKISRFPFEKRRVIAACSGGVDSTVLFGIFCELLKAKNIFSLELFHFNYGLRGEESVGDESFCRDLAQGAAVPFLCARATNEQRETHQGEGVQEWARRLRREALMKLGSSGSIVALAHHADDAAETVLMRMMRGTSLATMRGMSEWDGIWWRPWIRVPKVDIIAAALDRGMLFREDSTNEKLDYSRNVVRHRVLPELLRLWPAGREKLLDLADDAHAVASYALLKALGDASFKLTADEKSMSTPTCRRASLVELPEALALAVLAHMAQSTSAGAWKQLSRGNLLKVLAASKAGGQPRFVLELTKGLFLEVGTEAVRSFPSST